MIASGESTTFGGSGGSINEDNLVGNQFTYGLFSYAMHAANGQQF